MDNPLHLQDLRKSMADGMATSPRDEPLLFSGDAPQGAGGMTFDVEDGGDGSRSESNGGGLGTFDVEEDSVRSSKKSSKKSKKPKASGGGGRKLDHMFTSEPFQEKCRHLVHNSLFEAVVTAIVLSNTLCLAYKGPNRELTPWAAEMIDGYDFGCTLLYSFEMYIRIAAYGAVDGRDYEDEEEADIPLQRKALLRDPWGRLDFIVIFTTWLSYVVEWVQVKGEGELIKTSMLRSLRVLRILHSIQYFKAIRAILTSLQYSVAYLGDVLLVMFFLYVLFSIVAMTLFGGALRTQCVTQTEADDFVARVTAEAFDMHALKVYSTDPGPVQLEDSSVLFWWDKNIYDIGDVVSCPVSIQCPEPKVCQIFRHNPRAGYAGFDNFVAAMLSMVVLTTGDNWEDITYVLMDTEAVAAPFAYLFIGVVNVVLGMLVVELFTAVICSTFAEVREEGAASAFVTDVAQLPTYHSHSSDDGSEEEDDLLLIGGESKITHSKGSAWGQPKPAFYQVAKLEETVLSEGFESIILAFILLNSVALAVVHHDMHPTLNWVLDKSETLFTVIFIIEMLLKILALGFSVYLASNANKVDAIVNVLCVGALFPQGEGGEAAKTARLFRILRVFRAVRLVKLLIKYPSVKQLVDTIFLSMEAVNNLVFFLVYTLFVLSLFGMHMMGDEVQFEVDDTEKPRAHFSDFLNSFATALVMTTGDRWKVTMYSFVDTYGPWAAVYFVLLWGLCNLVILNLFIAVVLENFGYSDDEKRNLQKQRYVDSRRREVHSNWLIECYAKPYPRNNEDLEREQATLRKILAAAARSGTPPDDDVVKLARARIKELPKAKTMGPQSEEDLEYDTPVAKLCLYLHRSQVVEGIVTLMVLLSAVMISYEGPQGGMKDEPELAEWFHLVDNILLGGFWVEFVIRATALGFLLSPFSYLSHNWYKLDFSVLVVCTVPLAIPEWQQAASVFRLARLLRPIRLLKKIAGMDVLMRAIVVSIQSLTGIFVLGFVVHLIFGIVGVTMFAGGWNICSNDLVLGRIDCHGTTIDSSGKLIAATWDMTPGGNFDNIFSAMRTLFLVGTLAGWSDAMYQGMDMVGADFQPAREAHPYAALYFIAFVFVSAFFLSNLFVGVLITLLGTETGHALETSAQAKWVAMRILVKQVGSIDKNEKPEDMPGWRASLYHLIHNPRFEHFITGVIIGNTVAMLAEHWPADPSLVDFLHVVNMICLIIFTIEAVLKLGALLPAAYWEDNWNRLDMIVVLASWVSIFLNIESGVQVARCIRTVRVLLLLKSAKGLQLLFRTFLMSIPPSVNIVVLMCVDFFIFANIGMYFFGNTQLGLYYDDRGNFKTFAGSLKLLFQMCTGEDLLYIVHDLGVAAPHCIVAGDIDPSDGLISEYGTCGNRSMAFIFVSLFFVVSNYLLLNMIVAVIMSNFDAVLNMDNMEISAEDVLGFKKTWDKHVVSQGEDMLKIEMDTLKAFLEEIGEPLGWQRKTDRGDIEVPARWLNMVLHELEDMWALDPKTGGLGFDEVLLTLSMMYLSTDCLTYEEKRHKLERAVTDRSAKIVISSLKTWHKKNFPPADVLAGGEEALSSFMDILQACKSFRLKYLCFSYKSNIKNVDLKKL